MIYWINDFNPQYAHGITRTAYNIMFEYDEPFFLEKVTAMLHREPHDVTISLGNEGIHMMICDDDANEIDDAYLVLDYNAGKEMLAWLLGNDLTTAEFIAITQKILLTLAFMPAKHGGVSLYNLSPDEQQAQWEAWQFIKA